LYNGLNQKAFIVLNHIINWVYTFSS